MLLSYKAYKKMSCNAWIVLVPGAGATGAIWRRQLRPFRHNWNVIVLDLRGHGRSPNSENELYTFHSTAADIIDVMNEEGISEAHFVAMSLGSLLVETIAIIDPKLEVWAFLLMRFGNLTKHFFPYMWLYRLFAWIVMPGPHHLKTRLLFYSQAKRLSKAEFLRWYRMTADVQAAILENATRHNSIPTLYLMGEGDYMFRRHAWDRAHNRPDTSVVILENAGHVCNVEQSEVFNRAALEFIEKAERTSKTKPEQMADVL